MAETKKKRYCESQRRATEKWEKANIFRVTSKLPKEWESELKERINEVAGGSVSGYIKKLIAQDLQKEL